MQDRYMKIGPWIYRKILYKLHSSNSKKRSKYQTPIMSHTLVKKKKKKVNKQRTEIITSDTKKSKWVCAFLHWRYDSFSIND